MKVEDQKRAALEEHWRASERGDSQVEHAIYRADAILDYPQSGEQFRGRHAIVAQAVHTPPIDTSRSSGSLAARTSG